MKKQLIAAAVATAIAAPMAASADVTVYGRLHYSVDSLDYGTAFSGAIAGTGNDFYTTAGFDGLAVNSHLSRFGIKGSEDLGNGLSLVFQMEFQIAGEAGPLETALFANTFNTVNNNRNTYVALAGSWGVAGVGQVDTPLKSSTASLELFGDNIGDYQQLNFEDLRAPDAVFYMSPNWNGFSFVAGIVMPSVSTTLDGVEATSISATYSNGPFFATLAREDVSNAAAVATGWTEDKTRLGLGYTANGFHVGYIYEERDNIAGVAAADDSHWQLSGSYTAGNNAFKVAYGEADGTTAAGDIDQWTIGLDHKLSSRTNVYVTYSDWDMNTAGQDWSALSLGIAHNF
jgi:predicted porin